MFRSCSLCRYSVGPGRIMATPTQLEELTSWLANHSQAGTFRKPRFWLLLSAASFLLSAAALLAVFLPQPFGIPTAAADYLRVTVFFQFSVPQLGALVPESPNRNSLITALVSLYWATHFALLVTVFFLFGNSSTSAKRKVFIGCEKLDRSLGES